MLLPLGTGAEASEAGVAAGLAAGVAAAAFRGAAAIPAEMQTATTRTIKAIFFMAILWAACSRSMD